MTKQRDAMGRRKTREKQRASDGEIKRELHRTPRQSRRVKRPTSVFFKLCLLFSNQHWTTTVPHSKAPFYLRDRQSLSIPLWTVAPDYKTQIQQKRTIPLFSAPATQRTAWCHTDQQSGRVESCCAISSACSCFCLLSLKCSVFSTFSLFSKF